MKIEIVTRAEFYFVLTPEQLLVLLECSRSHYDVICKIASLPLHQPTTQADLDNKFLTTWENRRSHLTSQGLDSTVRATFTQVDTCLKILEVAPYCWPPTCTGIEIPAEQEKMRASLAKRQIADGLRKALMAAVGKANELTKSEEIDV